MKKSLFVVFAVVLSLALFSSVYAEPPEGMPMQGDGRGNPPMMGGPDLIMDMADELKLSEEQTQKIREIKDKSKRDFIQLRADMELNAVDIQDELKKDAPDKVKIDSLIDKMSAISSKMMKTRMGNLLDTKKILSKEQFSQLLSKMEKGKKNFWGKDKGKNKKYKNDTSK